MEKDMELRPQSSRKLEFDLDECQSLENINNDFVEPNILTKRKYKAPEIGMEFGYEENAFNSYNIYGRGMGFSIQRNWVQKNNNDVVRVRTFTCSCEGHRQKDKRHVNAKYSRPQTRTGCLARMTITLQANEKYVVSSFEATHNHELVSTPQSHMLKSQRRMSVAQAAQADIADSSGIRPKATVEFMSRQVGGVENLDFVAKDYNNYLQSKRTKAMRKGEAAGVLEYFERKLEENKSFYYAIQLDDEEKMTGIFWADAKSVADYGYFDDVICFDTTYRTNKYGRPFAPFVGVNHHKQSVVFGCALLYDETTESFKWLFKTFLKAMSGKEPMTILTDQCKAMANAIALVLPRTHHRICIWHMYQNAVKHLNHIFNQVINGFKPFPKDFNSCIYDHEEEDSFLKAWKSMLEKYNLQGNKWLQELFKEKEKWALVYGCHTFCADMISTQRSESINSLLRSYLSADYDLLQFFQHFERVLKDRRYRELEADFKSHQTRPNLFVPMHMMKHASSMYTTAVFKMFQNEYVRILDSSIQSCNEVGIKTEYVVTMYGHSQRHTVTFNTLENTVGCSCKKYEFVGILCTYVLKVLDCKNIKEVPPQYILKRWTKDAKAGIVRDNSGSIIQSDPKADLGRRYNELCHFFVQIAARAAETEGGHKITIDWGNKLLQEVEQSMKYLSCKEVQSVTSHDTNANVSKSTHAESLTQDNTLVELVDSATSPKAKGFKIKKRSKVGGPRIRSSIEKASRKKRARNETSHNSNISIAAPPLGIAAPLSYPSNQFI